MSSLIIISLPDGLYRQLEERARRQGRSLAQEIVSILTEAVAVPEPLSLLELRGLGREVWRGVADGGYVAKERSDWD